MDSSTASNCMHIAPHRGPPIPLAGLILLQATCFHALNMMNSQFPIPPCITKYIHMCAQYPDLMIVCYVCTAVRQSSSKVMCPLSPIAPLAWLHTPACRPRRSYLCRVSRSLRRMGLEHQFVGIDFGTATSLCILFLPRFISFSVDLQLLGTKEPAFASHTPYRLLRRPTSSLRQSRTPACPLCHLPRSSQ